jgi:competence protein ComEC
MRNLLLVILLLAALAGGSWLGSGKQPPPRVAGPAMKLHFIDVGEGDSILLESPDHHFMLVDAGDSHAGPEVAEYLRRQNVSRVDFLVLTHPQPDHIGGVKAVLDALPVQSVLDSGFPAGTRLQRRVMDDIDRRSVPYLVAYSGQHYRLGSGVEVEVLSPPRKLFSGTDNDSNNNSIVLRVTFGEVSAMLMGDIETPAETAILTNGRDIEGDILKVAHHGSGDSTSLDLLRRVRPAYVVVTAGVGNDQGHPHRSTMRRLDPESLGAEVFRTDRDGTIVLTTDGRTVVWETVR